jgi:hypothetical protein
MSSPLDGRIRKLAREEVTSMFATPATATAADFNIDRVAELQQQITDLHEHLHHAATTIKRLEDRVDVLEKTPSASEQAKTASRRGTARKETTE